MSTFIQNLPTWVPHEYQTKAIQKMLQQTSVGLFMDPGLGKTSTVLEAFRILKDAGLVSKMLIIAPLRPAYNVWPPEIQKWANFQDLTCTVIHGGYKEDRLRDDVDIYVINPEGLLWLLEDRKHPDRINIQDFDVLCIDESTKFKATNTRRFKALKKHLPKFRFRWILTGTPSPNGIQDLFGQIYILDLGRAMGTYITHFRNKYMFQSDYQGYQWELRPGAYEQIVDKIAPLIVQLSAEDHLDMPELINVTTEVTLPLEAQTAYRQVQEEFLALLEEGAIVASNAGAAGTKCRQIANGAVYIEGHNDEWIGMHTAKLDALDELLEELGDKPVLLLYEYRHDAMRIREQLGDRCADISGSTAAQATDYIKRFNNGTLPVLLGHPASMGHGLNLQGKCHHVIWFGIPWNLEYYSQAIARVYRQGQQADHVMVYHIVAKDTLDEKVMRVLASKETSQRNLLSALAQK